MLKRLCVIMLCLLLLFTAMTPYVSAATTEAEEMKTLCTRTYRKALYNTGRSSLSGLCGLMAGYYLWLLDVTKSAEVYNGNDYFDTYSNQLYTSMGNKVRTYSADTYSLAEALYTVTGGGTRDVYNLVACFQWTNTQAGGRFGHAVVIHAILDGQVYFTEGFQTSIGGAAGNPIVCSIDEFEAFYGDWTLYEGLVVLGRRDYTDYCTSYGTDLFICADKVLMLSQPCAVGENDCVQLRRTGKNEVLRTICIYKNDGDQLYYRVTDGDTVGYIPVSEAAILRVNTEGITANVEVAAVQENQPLQLQGNLLSDGSIIHSVIARITAADGTQIANTKWSVGSRLFDFAQLNELLSSVCAPENTYNIELIAQMENNVPEGEQLYIQRKNVTVWQTQLQFGTDAIDSVEVLADVEQIPDGWYWDGQAGYYYRDGVPRTGWFCDNGADYYFKEDGSVTTGWAVINGSARYFTQTGVMRTGWVETEQGWHYMRSNGAAVSGFVRISGSLYYFNEEYVLQTRCTVMVDGVLYAIDENGIVIEH